MVVGALHLGGNYGTEATHLYPQKMTTMQQIGIKSMATGAQRTDFSPKAEANHYMKEMRQKGKSLKNTSAQQTDHNLMAVLQCTIKSRVSVEHQTTTYLQATSA